MNDPIRLLVKPPELPPRPAPGRFARFFGSPLTLALSMFLLLQSANVFAGTFWAECIRTGVICTLCLQYAGVWKDYRFVLREIVLLRQLLDRGVPISLQVSAEPPLHLQRFPMKPEVHN